MKRQTSLVILLAALALAVLVYTIIAAGRDPLPLFQVFIDNLKSLSWSGQFNLDFSSYLFLSGLWIMWRSKFRAASIITGLAAMILGIVFFAPYLIYLIGKENGDLKNVLLGENR